MSSISSNATLVFVFDDDRVFREIPVDVLRQEGLAADVVGFDSIADLKQAAESVAPAVIITDGWGPTYVELDRVQLCESAQVAAL